MSESIVRTVSGDIDPALLGATDYHEHLLMRSPLLPGDELDDIGRSAEEGAWLREAGIEALIELTPIGVGRDPEGLAEIARLSGLRIVAATGVHREAHYPPGHWVHAADEESLTDLFTSELLDGCRLPGQEGVPARTCDVRAGVVKVGVGYWSISSLETRVLQAAAAAHQRTGAAVICHLEMGTTAHEVVELLTSAGLPVERLALAHVDRNPDPGLHAELSQGGVYLGYDGMARARYWPDSTIIDCLLATASRGRADRLLLGGDVARRRAFRSYGGLPGMDYLPRRFLPRLTEKAGAGLIHQLLVTNPATFLAFHPPPNSVPVWP